MYETFKNNVYINIIFEKYIVRIQNVFSIFDLV